MKPTTPDNKLSAALNTANLAHFGQTRDIGGVLVPYLVHPVAVLNYLVALGEKDGDVLCASLLHDAIEDAEDRQFITELINRDLGEDILSIVEELTLPEDIVTHSKSPLDMDRRKLKYAHIAKTMKDGSIEARKIKLADRICNVKDFVSSGDVAYAKKYYNMFRDAVYPINTEDGADPVLNTLVLDFEFMFGE